MEYRLDQQDFEFDDTNYWVDGWCFRPTDEVEKTAVLITYDESIINGDELIIPFEINGYKITEFADYIVSKYFRKDV